MKSKTLLPVISIIGILCLAAFLSAYHAAKTMARYNQASANAYQLSICLESFREDNGRYPISLPEALPKMSGESQASLNNILNGKLGGKYEYFSQTNRFEITIEGYGFECQALTNKIVVTGKYTTNEFNF